ncbi:hypothetical protein KM043_001847 [Ampulex compressa]|nr:hypothetical protein KM043_001847 [Ampulex compressa]
MCGSPRDSKSVMGKTNGNDSVHGHSDRASASSKMQPYRTPIRDRIPLAASTKSPHPYPTGSHERGYVFKRKPLVRRITNFWTSDIPRKSCFPTRRGGRDGGEAETEENYARKVILSRDKIMEDNGRS